MKFTITTDELEVLEKLAHSNDLATIADSLMRDKTVISRKLKKISLKAHVLKKENGQWRLNETGHQIIAAAKEAADRQNNLLRQHRTLKIGSSREFMNRILVPQLKELKKILSYDDFSLKSYESGVEAALMNGEIDIGLDCARPFSQDIRYRQITQEPFTIVYSKDFLKKYKKELSQKKLHQIPTLLFQRLPIGFLNPAEQNIFATFNDLGAAREACLAGFGWLLSPTYAVKKEILAGQLISQSEDHMAPEKYGIWWRRNQDKSQLPIALIEQWLKDQNLGLY